MVLPLVKNKVEGSCGFKTQRVCVQLIKIKKIKKNNNRNSHTNKNNNNNSNKVQILNFPPWLLTE